MISDCGVAAAKGNHVYALLTGEAVDSAEFAQSCDSDEAAITALINAAMHLDQRFFPQSIKPGILGPGFLRFGNQSAKQSAGPWYGRTVRPLRLKKVPAKLMDSTF